MASGRDHDAWFEATGPDDPQALDEIADWSPAEDWSEWAGPET